MPAYIPHIGGNYEGGEVVFGHRLKSRLPAKRVPEAVERWIRLYEDERDDGENFNAFVERVGTDALRGADQGPDAAGRVQPRHHAALHRLEPLRALQGRARRGRVRGLMEPTATRPDRDRTAAGRTRPRHDAGRRARRLGFDPRRSPPSSRTRAPRRRSTGRSSTFGTAHVHRLLVPEDELGDGPHGARRSTPTRASSTSTPTSSSRRPTRPATGSPSATGSSSTASTTITLEEQAGRYGDELWSRDPDACCGIRKVEPMRSALAAVDCWVSGIRREDSQTRAEAPKFGWDKRFGLWKLNPLADWSERAGLELHPRARHPLQPAPRPGLPLDRLHPLHPKPVGPARTPRDGRWAGLDKTECGINWQRPMPARLDGPLGYACPVPSLRLDLITASTLRMSDDTDRAQP